MNMFATQCSNPLDTNIATGMMVITALVIALALLNVSQIARHTNKLHSTPSEKASTVESVSYTHLTLPTT